MVEAAAAGERNRRSGRWGKESTEEVDWVWGLEVVAVVWGTAVAGDETNVTCMYCKNSLPLLSFKVSARKQTKKLR